MSNLDWLKSDVKNKKVKGYCPMHETKNGRAIPIHAMDDEHIKNMCNLMIHNAKDLKSRAVYEVNTTLDAFDMELNGEEPVDKNEAISIIKSIMYKLQPYIMELVIRNRIDYLSNIYRAIEEILGRRNNNLKLKGEVDDELLS